MKKKVKIARVVVCQLVLCAGLSAAYAAAGVAISRAMQGECTPRNETVVPLETFVSEEAALAQSSADTISEYSAPFYINETGYWARTRFATTCTIYPMTFVPIGAIGGLFWSTLLLPLAWFHPICIITTMTMTAFCSVPLGLLVMDCGTDTCIGTAFEVSSLGYVLSGLFCIGLPTYWVLGIMWKTAFYDDDVMVVVARVRDIERDRDITTTSSAPAKTLQVHCPDGAIKLAVAV